jgi:enoyl-CoA hydratase/carnithine racemase
VNRVVEPAALMPEALEVATTIASRPRRGIRTTLGYLALQADLSKHEALHLSAITPDYMGLTLRPFEDAAARFFGERDASLHIDGSASAREDRP